MGCRTVTRTLNAKNHLNKKHLWKKILSKNIFHTSAKKRQLAISRQGKQTNKQTKKYQQDYALLLGRCMCVCVCVRKGKS